MKPKHFLFVFAIVTLFSYASCKKTTTEDPHNHSLLTKTLPQIQAEIAGKWQVQRWHYFVCGSVTCNTKDSTYPSGKGDIINFAANDTIIQSKWDYSVYYIYEKAVITKEKNYDMSLGADSIYHFNLQGGYTQFIMYQIKNDTLVLNGGPFYTYYAIRKL